MQPVCNTPQHVAYAKLKQERGPEATADSSAVNSGVDRERLREEEVSQRDTEQRRK